jgi:hypothetical protein
MRTIGALALLVTLASAGPEAARIRYRDGGLEAALAEAKAKERPVLVVLWMDG